MAKKGTKRAFTNDVSEMKKELDVISDDNGEILNYIIDKYSPIQKVLAKDNKVFKEKMADLFAEWFETQLSKVFDEDEKTTFDSNEGHVIVADIHAQRKAVAIFIHDNWEQALNSRMELLNPGVILMKTIADIKSLKLNKNTKIGDILKFVGRNIFTDGEKEKIKTYLTQSTLESAQELLTSLESKTQTDEALIKFQEHLATTLRDQAIVDGKKKIKKKELDTRRVHYIVTEDGQKRRPVEWVNEGVEYLQKTFTFSPDLCFALMYFVCNHNTNKEYNQHPLKPFPEKLNSSIFDNFKSEHLDGNNDKYEQFLQSLQKDENQSVEVDSDCASSVQHEDY